MVRASMAIKRMMTHGPSIDIQNVRWIESMVGSGLDQIVVTFLVQYVVASWGMIAAIFVSN
jgi:hypothetical protein